MQLVREQEAEVANQNRRQSLLVKEQDTDVASYVGNSGQLNLTREPESGVAGQGTEDRGYQLGNRRQEQLDRKQEPEVGVRQGTGDRGSKSVNMRQRYLV